MAAVSMSRRELLRMGCMVIAGLTSFSGARPTMAHGAPTSRSTGIATSARDNTDVGSIRSVFAQLPPGATPMRLAVPAFWTLEPQYDQHWQALKDAGCRNWDMIEHCRSPHPHFRGCWVVDLALGKS